MKRPTLRPKPALARADAAFRGDPPSDADLARLIQLCLTLPKARRTLAAELLSILKRAQE